MTGLAVGLGVGLRVGRAVGFGVGASVGEAEGSAVWLASGEFDDDANAPAVAVAFAFAGLADAPADPFGTLVGEIDVQAERLATRLARTSRRIARFIALNLLPDRERPNGTIG